MGLGHGCFLWKPKYTYGNYQSFSLVLKGLLPLSSRCNSIFTTIEGIHTSADFRCNGAGFKVFFPTTTRGIPFLGTILLAVQRGSRRWRTAGSKRSWWQNINLSYSDARHTRWRKDTCKTETVIIFKKYSFTQMNEEAATCTKLTPRDGLHLVFHAQFNIV